ncbi:Hint domain-containing protein [Sphingobium sp. HBC34]|uniref:Hint domain-containing protein n=1 Tax=Sphingobium cyanobacteriorum TaxID=3063954 RepID=A0ABT8ZL71_9SPHN|nr:Hint domain-containing protein [Sphingobium sp. HBC34]MDO7835288.1 Hint domain-containing protein [Sphingobium sp. HBC34]
MTTYTYTPPSPGYGKSWFDPLIWSTGTVPNASDADVFINTITNIGTGEVQNSGINIAAGSSVTVNSLFVENNAVFLLGSLTAGDLTLGGGGSISMSEGAALAAGDITVTGGAIIAAGTLGADNVVLADGGAMTAGQGGVVATFDTLTLNDGSLGGGAYGNLSLTTDPGAFSNLVNGVLDGGTYNATDFGLSSDTTGVQPGDPQGILLNVGGGNITSLLADVSLQGNASIYSFDTTSNSYVDMTTTLQEIQQEGSLTLSNGSFEFGALDIDGALNLTGSVLVSSSSIHISDTGVVGGLGVINGPVDNDGVINVGMPGGFSPSSLSIQGPLTGDGVIHIFGRDHFTYGSGYTLNIAGASSNDVIFDDSRATLIIGDPDSFTGTLTPYAGTADGTLAGNVVLKDVNFSSATASYLGSATGGTLTVNDGTSVVTLQLSGNFNNSSFALSEGRTFSSDPPTTKIVINYVCFVTGTLIRTDRGDVAVEELAVGDRVMTASGALQPVTWIGQRTLTGIADAAQAAAWPVRVKAGAFGTNRPDRDLLLSAGHAVCVDVMGEMFVPVGRLVNGGTIARVPMDTVTYWHVELDQHDVLLSNNLPSESYLDVGNRAWFSGLGTDLPDAAAQDSGRYARPFVDNGPIVEAIRLRLAEQARRIGWADTSDMDVHLVVDGVRVDGDMDGDLARFIFPATAREVVLRSHCFVPAHADIEGDQRALGICLTGLTLSDGLRAERTVTIDHAMFDSQHALEQGGGRQWRWTKGAMRLDPALWDGLRSHVILRLDMLASSGRRWVAPVQQEDMSMPASNVVALRA